MNRLRNKLLRGRASFVVVMTLTAALLFSQISLSATAWAADGGNEQASTEQANEQQTKDKDEIAPTKSISTLTVRGMGNMSAVYVCAGEMGSGTEDDPTSWLMALEKVAPEGTIYIMGTAGSGGTPTIVLTSDETYDLQGATIAPYAGSRGGGTLETSLMKIQRGANVTFVNTVFDGKDADRGYVYDQISVDEGSLTLGEGTVVQNFINGGSNGTEYGAALTVYQGATLNLNGTKVENNKCGVKKQPQVAGGITVGGTLNIGENTEINGNTIYDDTTNPLDILVNKGGTVNLDGGAKVGTIGFSSTKTDADKINITSPLQSDINFRMHKYMDINGGTLVPEFVRLNVLAQGNGYVLTDEDISRMRLWPIPVGATYLYYVEMNADKKAYVESGRYAEIKRYRALDDGSANGTVQVVAERHPGEAEPAGGTLVGSAMRFNLRAIPGTKIILMPDPAPGYKYVKGSLYLDDDNEVKLPILSAVPGTKSFQFNAPSQSTSKYPLYIGAQFDVMPKEPTPNIVIDYFNETLTGFTKGKVYLIDGAEYTADSTGTIPAVPQMGKTISIVQKGEEDNTYDSDPQSLNVPLRPAIPTCSAVDASTAASKDGSISVTTPSGGLEYKAAAGSGYTSVAGSTITGLGVGEYHVHYAATGSSFASLNALVHVFSNTSVVHEITGSAVDTSDQPIPNAVVELYHGTKLLGRQLTALDGTFKFEKIPDGLYQLVVIYNNVTVTVETQVMGSDANAGKIIIPAGEKNSIVQLTEKAPPLVVDQLPNVYATPSVAGTEGVTQQELDDLANTAISKITIKLVGDSKTEATALYAADIKGEAASNKKTVGSYLDLSIYKEITASNGAMTATKLEKVPNLIKITIPLDPDMQKKNGYVVYRYHGAVHAIKEGAANKNGDGEYFDINSEKTIITLYTKKFSTYAISYDVSGGSGQTSGGNGSGGNGKNTYPVTTESDKNGSISADKSSASYGETVTITVKPEAGYILDKLVIKGTDGKIISAQNKGDNTYTFTMPSNSVTITATFSKQTAELSVTGVSDWLITDDHIAYMKGDDLGNFNPTWNMTRAETAQMFYNLLKNKEKEVTVSFYDVPEKAWYANAVNTLASMNIISGFEGQFRPHDSITRGEFTTVAMRFARMTEGNRKFSDVPESSWAYKYIAAAAEYGWVNGYEDNTFRPDNGIARAEVSAIVNHMLTRIPDTVYIDGNKASLKIFPDAADPGYWAWYHIVETTNAHDFTKTGGQEIWTSQK